MSEKCPHYVIVDPGFSNLGGHHYTVNQNLGRNLESSSITCLTSTDLPPDVSCDNLEIVRAFSLNLYPENYECLEYHQHLAAVAAWTSELRIAFAELKAEQKYVIVVHTGQSFLYEALARALTRSAKNIEGLIISLMFFPGSHSEEYPKRLRHLSAFKSLLKLERDGHIGLGIGVPTWKYLKATQDLLPGKEICVHPSVVPGIPDLNIEEEPFPEVLLHMGAPKTSKGFDFVLEIAERLRADNKLAGFGLQFNNHFGEGAWHEDKIRELERAGLTVFWGELPPERYQGLLAHCKIFCLLYEPDSYARKTSGVFWEILPMLHQKIAICTEGTLQSEELRQLGANFFPVTYGDVGSFLESLTAAMNSEVIHDDSKIRRQAYFSTLTDSFPEWINRTAQRFSAATAAERPEKLPRIAIIRTHYGHFTEISGPAGYVEWLAGKNAEIDIFKVPLGHDLVSDNTEGKWQYHEWATGQLSSYQLNSMATELSLIGTLSDYDVIHFLDAEHSGLSLLEATESLPHKPTLVGTFHQPKAILESLIKDKGFLHRYDKIHILSPCQRSFFSEAGIENESIQLVPHGLSNKVADRLVSHASLLVDDDDLDAYTSLSQGAQTIALTVGTWLRDYAQLADIARALEEKRDLRFIVCARGLEAQELEQLDNVAVLNGGVSDSLLHLLYRMSDFLLLPLEDGCANNAILEAIANKLPIITSDLASTRYYSSGQAIFCESTQDFIKAVMTFDKANTSIAPIDWLRWKEVALQMQQRLYSVKEVL